jgi:hypothetical protein
MGIQANPTSFNLYLWQSKYVGDLLHHSKMLGAKPYTSHGGAGSKLSTHSVDVNETFCQIIRVLQYWILPFAVN